MQLEGKRSNKCFITLIRCMSNEISEQSNFVLVTMVGLCRNDDDWVYATTNYLGGSNTPVG